MEKIRYSIGIAATKNENGTLERTIETLVRDLLESQPAGRFETLLCLNNYDQETERVSEEIVATYAPLNIRTMNSQTGLINAQRMMISQSRSESDFIIFYDSDILIRPCTTRAITEFMDAHPEVKVGSADQVAKQINSFWYQVYNVIGLNPPLMTPRKYINGRAFAIRKSSYAVPNKVHTEDTFLSHKLVFENGPEAVQTIPGAAIEYLGPRTLSDYFQKVRRLDLVRGKIYTDFPEYQKIAHLFRKERVKDEIDRLGIKARAQLVLHDGILKVSKRLANLSKSPVWVTLKSTKETT